MTRNRCLILLSIFELLACSGKRLRVGEEGGAGGQAGSRGGQGGAATGAAGTAAGAAGSIMPTGTGGSGGSGGATGAGGAAGQAGAGGAAGGSELSVNPGAATFASTLVEAVSAPQTFTVRNDGSTTAGTTTTLAAAFAGANAADFVIASNGCGPTLQPGASCEIAVAFAPQTRSGSRTASLMVGATSGVAANVSLSGTALPSLGLLAGGIGGAGTADGTGAGARFYGPSGIASDEAGNLYVADAINDTIRKVVIATGAVSTFAGAPGQYGSVDGTGAAARFYGPSGLASDGTGNLYVADRGNHTVRKIVIATGAVSTLAGTAGQFGSADATGVAAGFNYPADVASDGAGNLYVTDSGNHTVRKIVIATRTVTTLAGAAGKAGSADATGAAARFDEPSNFASDGAGNLYVTDTGNGTIRKIVVATRTVTTLAGAAGQTGSADGTGAAARFFRPGGIAGDGAGNLYVADSSNNTVRKVVIATGAVSTLAGAPGQFGTADGTGAAARFNSPWGVTSDGAGNLYVADSSSNTIRKVAVATGAVITFAGAAGRVRNANGTRPTDVFNRPTGIAGDGAGNLYVADTVFSTIRKVVIATGAVTTLAGGATQVAGADGTGAGASFFAPGGIASDGAGNLYVADTMNNTIRKVAIATGVVTTLAGTAGQAGGADGTGAAARFSWPNGIVSDGGGNLYVADTTNGTVRKVVIATGVVTTLANGLTQPSGIAADGAGNLYVSDTRDSTIKKVVIATGAVAVFAGTSGQFGHADGTGAAARFFAPWGVASDGAGTLYVGDASNNAIRKIVIATGAVTTLAGTAGWGQYGNADGMGAAARFYDPTGIAVDGTGNLYVADSMNGSIRKVVMATGAVTTLAGGPAPTSSADGTGAAARFTGPTGIAGDGAGNLYVTDGDDTVRKVVIATRAVTIFAGMPAQQGNVDGTGLGARFIFPNGIGGDGAGNLYVADGTTIRQIALAPGAVTTLAGAPNASGSADGTGAAANFARPNSVVADGTGNLYVADSSLDTCNCIRKIVIATGAVTTLAGGPEDASVDGTGRAAHFVGPWGIASDGAGNLYVTDSGAIRKVVIATGAVTTFAGAPYETGSANGTGPAARFVAPSGIAGDGAGNLYVADGNTIRKVVIGTATVSTIIGSPYQAGVSLGALPASLNGPRGVVVLPTGELAIVDGAENAVLIGHL